MGLRWLGVARLRDRPARGPYPNDPALNTTTLEESGGVTTMTVLVQVKSQDLRDAILASGMETGMQVSYNRLEDLVRQAAA